MSNLIQLLQENQKLKYQLEKLKRKQFQFFPLRKECTIKYIPIDTKTLIEIFIDTKKGEYLANIDKYKNTIWSKIFKLYSKIFRKNNYNFNYMIYTDCKGVSILFTDDSTKQKSEQKNATMKDAKQKIKRCFYIAFFHCHSSQVIKHYLVIRI